jgi:class 3 adenylate cyclase/dienelactone hydrolase
VTDPATRASLLCLVFTDLVDSTALKTRLGDAAVSELMAAYHRDVLALAGEGGGREIDSAGDGFFLAFEAPSAAVAFALRLQQLHQRKSELPAVRVGLHLGEVTERPAPAGSSKPTLIEGLAVDLAARIGGLAGAAQVLMSRPVFDAARQRLDEGDLGKVSWRAHGPYLLKGIDEPVDIGEAGFEGVSPLAPPPDSEKARSATAAGEELTLGWRPAVGLAIPGRSNWRLLEQLGTGAIGEVWLAAHEGTSAKRVFKFCFQAESLRSLKREVALLRILKENLGERPDIAQVIDWEFGQPPYFLETEHSEAGDLVAWGKQQGGIDKVPLATRVDVVAQMADALAAAHGAGVLHKDLKPANVLIREGPEGQPRVCLSDFGIGLLTSREALETPGVTVAGLTEALLSSSVETGAGTRLYMAPEVMEGRPATPLSDVYSLGVILYQLVAADFGRALATGWERDIADPLLRADISACVDGDPEKRVGAPAELARRLRALPERRARLRGERTRRRGLRVGAAATVALLLAAGGWWAWGFYSKIRWAQNVAGPEILHRIETSDIVGAYDLAGEVEDALGSNPALDQAWQQIATTISFETEPPGAEVFWKDYTEPDGAWRRLGTTPIEDVRVPAAILRWRVEKPGYEAREIAHQPARFSRGLPFEWKPKLILDPEGTTPPGTVPVEGRRYAAVPLGGFGGTGGFELARSYIDRTEVTNAAYQEFVDAGGYRRAEYWTEPFVDGERTLGFDEAMARFVDSTGRPGPATWVLGEHPEGRADHPVGGVSWYEAAAYAAFRERDLPTVYHWAAAALPDAEIAESLAPDLSRQSNMDADGPAPVGSHPGLSAVGAADMAGNVSEWVWNASGTNRFLLGGAWDDPEYRFHAVAATSPWRRRATDGFRLATYPEPPAEFTRAARELPKVDYFTLAPSSDADAEFERRSAAYDRTPLNTREEGALELPSGAQAVRVSVDGAVRGERLPIYVLEPEGVGPPYQAVVWMGGVNILMDRSTERGMKVVSGPIDFLRKSGRMVVMPVFASTMERIGEQSGLAAGPVARRERRAEWSKDLGRTLDYLETRGDVDMERVAFIGLSLGASVGLRIVPLEERIATLMLWSGGFGAATPPEEAPAVVRAAEETEVPVLMLNGRHDFVYPYETHQRALFERLGTPPELKRHVVWDAGHLGPPIGEFIRENLDWLDQRFGPVARAE